MADNETVEAVVSRAWKAFDESALPEEGKCQAGDGAMEAACRIAVASVLERLRAFLSEVRTERTTDDLITETLRDPKVRLEHEREMVDGELDLIAQEWDGDGET